MMTQQRYVAGRRLKIGDGYRQIGEPVPEAAGWKHLESYLNSGHVKIVPAFDWEIEQYDQLIEMSKNELIELAKEKEIVGYSDMNKRQLSESLASIKNVFGGEDGETEDDLTQYHAGKGWYEFPSGERIRGRKAAEEALAERRDELIPPTDDEGDEDKEGGEEAETSTSESKSEDEESPQESESEVTDSEAPGDSDSGDEDDDEEETASEEE